MSTLLTAFVLGTAVLGQTPELADLKLVDQFGNAGSLADHRDQVVVVMVVTARRLRNLKAWEKDLRERYDDIYFLRIADIPPDPPVTHEQVARKFTKRVPEEVSIFIDIEGQWARGLELDTGRPNLLLFDREGKLAAAFRGRWETAPLKDVYAAMDELMGGP
jgi:hypothetical protein